MVPPDESGYNRWSIGAVRRASGRSGEQKVLIFTQGKPVYAGVDPYIKFLDRNVSDHVIAKRTASASTMKRR